MSLQTVVKIEDSKYGKTFGVYSLLGVTAGGEDILSEKPIVRFGIKKATALLPYTEELAQYVTENK